MGCGDVNISTISVFIALRRHVVGIKSIIFLSILQFCVLCMLMLCTFLVFYFCAASHGVIKNDYMRFRITIANRRRMFLGYFCSSKRSSKE